MIRAVAIAAIVIVAALVTPYALQPGLNSADIIWILSPAGILAVGWPRDRSRPNHRAVSEHFAAGREDGDAAPTVSPSSTP